MGTCRGEGHYTTTEVVLHGALVCFGGFGQPKCRYLKDCLEENGYIITVSKAGRRRIKRIKEQK
jgi:hypothetical protein